MAKHLTVVLSQGQSANPVKRGLEEEIVARLVMEGGFDVAIVPNLYDLTADHTGMLCLQGIGGDFVLLSWLYSRAAHWVLDRYGIRGQFGTTLLKAESDDEDDEVADEVKDSGNGNGDDKPRVVDQRPMPNRRIYCLDLKVFDKPEPYLVEIRRIAREAAVPLVQLGGPLAMRVANESPPAAPAVVNENGNGQSPPIAGPIRIADEASRRWYPVIDYSRCTNCMECIDFCLFGVYGVDKVDTILVEQPDNCRKGCPACSRVCPENAIIFPQHKTPGIAGSPEGAGTLKIDLSQLFGGGGESAIEVAAKERDEQLVLVGRDAVGLSVGIPKRQADKPRGPKDDLDALVDALDNLEL